MRSVVLTAVLCLAAAGCGQRQTPTQPAPQPPPCSFALAPATGAFGSDGGSGSVTVTTQTGCAWSVANTTGWITITSGGSGSGSGTVAYSVSANNASESRSAVLTIEGQSHSVTQEGRAPTVCRYDTAPAGARFDSGAGNGTFAVTAPDGCVWAATSTVSWIAVTAGAQGSGNGSVSYGVASNTDPADRAGSIRVADRTFVIEQSGNVASCEYAVSPVQFSPCMAGGTLTATITTRQNCPWSAVAEGSWLEVRDGPSRSGPGTIAITYSDNYDAPRQGLVLVRWPTPTAGQNIRVSQAGCLYGVTQTAFTFAAVGGTATFDVLQQSEPIVCGGATQDRCLWTARSDAPWLTITTAMPRTGDDRVSFVVAPNDGATARTGRITVRDKVVAVTQSGR